MNKIVARISRLETAVFGQQREGDFEAGISSNPLLLQDLARKAKKLSGQKKIALIVGYLEKVQNLEKITTLEIKNNWEQAKFKGKYNSTLLLRAEDEGLLRTVSKGTFDLSLEGEEFFSDFTSISNE